jgi:hypothetical protein
MSEMSAEQQASLQIDESRVIEYLQKNPAILMAYPDIFSSLSIPHQAAGATSLVGRQIKLLREDNQRLRSKIDELVAIARENEELNQRFHRLALELMETEQLHDALATVQNQVQTFFSSVSDSCRVPAKPVILPLMACISMPIATLSSASSPGSRVANRYAASRMRKSTANYSVRTCASAPVPLFRFIIPVISACYA